MSISAKESERRRAMIARQTTHGMSRTPEYLSWVAMIQRCCNPNATGYHNYGGRGITVCQRWKESFAAFFSDMGKRPSLNHTIDRFPNNDGNYEPGNCRWATPKEQKRNSRAARRITFRGETKTIVEWSEHTGQSRFLIRKRIAAGWTPEAALTTPTRQRRKTPCTQR